MKDAMEKLPNPICWYEGMMLSPQHFQQNQRYMEAQLHALLDCLTPNSWGLKRLEFDHAALAGGKLNISKVQALMPDGLFVDYSPPEVETLSLSLSDVELLNQKRRVTIHLVVPIRIPGCASDSVAMQRYVSKDSPPVVDDNTGQGELVMQRLAPKLALQAIEMVSENYTSIPLFEVSLLDSGSYQLGDYCPPLLNIGAQCFAYEEGQELVKQPLQNRCKNIAMIMRNKADKLAGYSGQGEERLGHKITEVHAIWINVLTKMLPQFELLADDRNTTPFQLYSCLAALVGNFCKLDPSYFPKKLPAYKHTDMLEGFNMALAYIQRQLEVVNLRFTSIDFDESREGLFTLQYDKAWAGQDLLVELSAYDKGTTEELVSWFKACRIASTKMHDALAKGRLLGAHAESIERDPQTGIRVASGRALFLIKADAKIILPGQQLIVLCTSGGLKANRPKRITLHLPHEARN